MNFLDKLRMKSARHKRVDKNSFTKSTKTQNKCIMLKVQIVDFSAEKGE